MDYSRIIGQEPGTLRSLYPPRLVAKSCSSSTLLGPGTLRSSTGQRRVTSHFPSVASAPAGVGSRVQSVLHRSAFLSRPASHCLVVETGWRGSRAAISDFGGRCGTRAGPDVSDPGRVHRLVRSFSGSTCVLDASTSTSRRPAISRISVAHIKKFQSDRRSSFIKLQTIKGDDAKPTNILDEKSEDIKSSTRYMDCEKRIITKDKQDAKMKEQIIDEQNTNVSFSRKECSSELERCETSKEKLTIPDEIVKQNGDEVAVKPMFYLHKKSEISPDTNIIRNDIPKKEEENDHVELAFDSEAADEIIKVNDSSILSSSNSTDKDLVSLDEDNSETERRVTAELLPVARVPHGDGKPTNVPVYTAEEGNPVSRNAAGDDSKASDQQMDRLKIKSTSKRAIQNPSTECNINHHNKAEITKNNDIMAGGNKECHNNGNIEKPSTVLMEFKEESANKENKEKSFIIFTKSNLVVDDKVKSADLDSNSNNVGLREQKNGNAPGKNIEPTMKTKFCSDLKRSVVYGVNNNTCSKSEHMSTVNERKEISVDICQNQSNVNDKTAVIGVKSFEGNCVKLCPNTLSIPNSEAKPSSPSGQADKQDSKEKETKVKLKRTRKPKVTNLDDTKEQSDKHITTDNAKISSNKKKKRTVKKCTSNGDKEKVQRLTPEQQEKIDRLTRFRERGQRTKLIIERMKMEDDPVSYMKNESNIRFALKIKQQELLKQQQQGSSELSFTNSEPQWPHSLEKYYLQYGQTSDECADANKQRSEFNPLGGPMPKYKVYSIEDFTLLRVLGQGGFGKVILGQMRGTSNYFAVKCLKKSKVISDEDYDDVTTEQKVLTLATNHSFLCHLFCTFQTSTHLFFILEFLNGGDLNFHLHRLEKFPAEVTRFYAAEIICGLKFLHRKGIIYRDLKLDNVLLDFQGHVRLADFGMCITKIFLDRTANTFCGTVDYMAPEMILGQSYNQAVDWWSFGVLLYEMLVGLSPFYGLDEQELFLAIRYEEPYYPKFMQGNCVDIIKWLLQKDPVQRLGSCECPAGPVTSQPFLGQLNWLAVENKQLRPPLVPQLSDAADCRHFDEKYRAMSVVLTQCEQKCDQELTDGTVQDRFAKFVYTNPNLTD